jgi:hypothetical protein
VNLPTFQVLSPAEQQAVACRLGYENLDTFGMPTMQYRLDLGHPIEKEIAQRVATLAYRCSKLEAPGRGIRNLKLNGQGPVQVSMSGGGQAGGQKGVRRGSVFFFLAAFNTYLRHKKQIYHHFLYD